MSTLFQAALLTSLFVCQPHSQKITVRTTTSKDDYLNIEVKWGTGSPQTFHVLVDTTDHTSWVYNQSANTNQPKFNPSLSPTFTPLDSKETFSYQNQETEIHLANDTLYIDNQAIQNTEFAVATKNFSITDNETLSGFLCLDRLSNIVPALYANNYIANKTISIDTSNNRLYFGEYTPSSYTINNVSNATVCSTTSNVELNKIWTFDIEVFIDDIRAAGNNPFKGVIDSASPYITIYARTESLLQTLWHLIDGTNDKFNCNYTTRVCDNVKTIMNWMTISMIGVGWNTSFFRSDIISGDKILFFYDGDTDYTTEYDADYVLFLGRPFLKQLLVSMDYSEQSLTFYSLKISNSSSLNWIPIIIVFACVVAFAGIFFGIYYWKFGKIPPPSNHDVEEQSLLRGPVQAVGSSQPVPGNIQQVQGSSAVLSSGVSGLDEDDDELQRQIQQAQRLSAIEAQQRREQQARIDRDRQAGIQMDEEKQQQELQQAQRVESKRQQRIGSSSGVGKPQDADDLRRARLKFLEEQQKKQQENQDD